MEPVRILIADDHCVLRAGIRALLEDVAGLAIVGEAGNGEEALAGVEAHRPDLLLTDIAMPGMNGLDLANRVSRDFPGVKTIILSMHSDMEYAHMALQAGAMGYLIKNCGTAELRL